MNKGFELYRRLGHRLVSGWLAPEVLEILSVLDATQRSKNISGAVAEIGVHHGRLFIGLNLLRRANENSVAIDVFDQQDLNIDASGKGNLALFRRNVNRWSSLESVAIHQGDSTQLRPDDLLKLARTDIRLFSVDGGHTDPIVFSDMNLADSTVVSGGIVIADDIFNEAWPGVSTGTLRYLSHGGKLAPFAIGFNKVLFASPEHSDEYRRALRNHFEGRYFIVVKTSEFAAQEVLVITRVPRRPRLIIGRSQTARRIYHRVQERRRK